MGIDKPDVRLVVHYTFPKTLEGYYQEIGRAGRDGLDSKCVMFYTYADLRKHEFFINRISDHNLSEIARGKLSEVLNFCELSTCRKKYLLKYFDENMLTDNCQACDICLTEREKFDASIISKKILSAILRTNSRFGKNYISDVLLGKNTQKIRINEHDQLSVFAIVKDMNKDELGQIIKQLLDLDYIQKSEGQYPILSLTKKGILFLQDDKKLELNKPTIDISDTRPKKASLDYNQDLFQILRSLRKELADTAGVPPFVIFGDKSLMEMAYYFPQGKDNFSQITGVGAKKLEEFSKEFLKTINNFIKNNNVTPIEFPSIDKHQITTQIKIRRPQYHQKTKELISKKIPIKRIAKNQGKKLATIINHIEKLIDAGDKLDLEYLKLPKDKYEIISQAFLEVGDEKLKPIFEHLNGKYDYDDLKLIRVLLRT
jgi:ATP-dependent DNA helicase RecQ